MFLAADSTCVTNCGDGLWGETGVNLCRDCEPGCKVCTGYTFANCVNECPLGSPYQIRSFSYIFSQCVTSCPFDMYADIRLYCQFCDINCKSCLADTANDCTSCKHNFWLRDVVPPTSDCVLNCAINKYKHTDATCRDCHPTCGSCIKGDTLSCLSCANPAHFKLRASSSSVQFECVADCPLGKYKDTGLLECLTCTSNCLECTTATDCLQCAPGYHQLDFANPTFDPNPCSSDPICEVTTWLNSTY